MLTELTTTPLIFNPSPLSIGNPLELFQPALIITSHVRPKGLESQTTSGVVAPSSNSYTTTPQLKEELIIPIRSNLFSNQIPKAQRGNKKRLPAVNRELREKPQRLVPRLTSWLNICTRLKMVTSAERRHFSFGVGEAVDILAMMSRKPDSLPVPLTSSYIFQEFFRVTYTALCASLGIRSSQTNLASFELYFRYHDIFFGLCGSHSVSPSRQLSQCHPKFRLESKFWLQIPVSGIWIQLQMSHLCT